MQRICKANEVIDKIADCPYLSEDLFDVFGQVLDVSLDILIDAMGDNEDLIGDWLFEGRKISLDDLYNKLVDQRED